MLQRWKEALNNKQFQLELPTFSIICFVMLYYSPEWMTIVENQKGDLLYDPILDALKPVDFSSTIMSLIYGSLFISLGFLLTNPMQFMLSVKTFYIVVTLRYLLIYLIPLEPHPDIILLKDPFLAMIVYDSMPITKDLFFSGHMFTMVMACIFMPYKPLKYILILAAIALGTLLMVQHVHYSYDVFAAVIITWGGYRIAQLNWLVKPFMQNSQTQFSKENKYEGKMSMTESRKAL
ncbi:MAG: hypothetical protein EAZ27_03620 [Cytophagales bacterium]|nr:MAG: hypothetical protein EAZ27_03620 [Cytophagales bacterium]